MENSCFDYSEQRLFVYSKFSYHSNNLYFTRKLWPDAYADTLILTLRRAKDSEKLALITLRNNNPQVMVYASRLQDSKEQQGTEKLPNNLLEVCIPLFTLQTNWYIGRVPCFILAKQI
jgi:hypothetical protein